MRNTWLLLFIVVFQVYADDSYSQNTKLTLNLDNATVAKVLEEIENNSEFYFLFNAKLLDVEREVSITMKDKTIPEILTSLFSETDVQFVVYKSQIILSQSDVSTLSDVIQQQQKVIGTVTDKDGMPFPGVNVVITGTTHGTMTDIDGKYSIEVPQGARSLTFSFVGMEPMEITIGTLSQINVTLAESSIGLDEVVVIGYGTTKKVSLTSAVDVVNAQKLTERTTATFTQQLQGLLPGMTIIDYGGRPGSERLSLNIRGMTTLGNNKPLVIVDGIEQDFETLNTQDIQNVSLLKDAASTAIYGSRGSNGVLLITTKRGAKGEIKVNYDGNVSFQNMTLIPQHMDVEPYLRLRNLSYENRGSVPPYTEEDIENWVKGEDRLRYPLPYDWFNVVIRDNAPMTNQVLSLSGGSDILQTIASINYFTQEGIYPNHNSNRYQVRINNNLQVSDHIAIEIDANYRKNYSFVPNGYRGNPEDIDDEEGSYNLYRHMVGATPFTVPRYPDGTYGLSARKFNPLFESDPEFMGYVKDNQHYLVLNSKLKINIIKNLDYTFQYGMTNRQDDRFATHPTYEVRDYWNPEVILRSERINTLYEKREENIQTTLNSLLNYNFVLNNNHINALLGYSQISNDYKSLNAYGRRLYNNDILTLGETELENRNIGSQYIDWRLRSVFGRINYDFLNKYLLEVNLRYDGSSRFPTGNRYTFFPSLSGAWRMSEEQFFKNLKGIIDDFKLRVSWGETGNQNIGLYTYIENLNLGNYYVFNGIPVSGVRQTEFASKELTWETTSQYNFGLDVTLFRNRLALTFDYYNKQTKGILLNLPIPATVGLNPVASNAGQVENKGWEFNSSWRDSRGDFSYGLTFNISDVKNKVVSLEGTGPYYSGSRNVLITKEGLPINSIWAYRANALLTQSDIDSNYPTIHANPQPGDIKYIDLNNDGKIDSEDKDYLGSTIPRYTYMVAGNFRYKNLDLNLHFQGVGKVFVQADGNYIEGANYDVFCLAIHEDHWTPDNPNARFPRPVFEQNHNTANPSEWWTLNGSYLRLKNLQLGYTLPASFSNKIGLSTVRFYLGGTNLFAISELNQWGMDPEVNSGRMTRYPQTKQYILGLSVNF